MDALLPKVPENNRSLFKRSLRLYAASFPYTGILSIVLAFIVFIPRFVFHMTGYTIGPNIHPLNLNNLFLILINMGSLIFFIAMIWHMYCVSRKRHEPFMEDFVMGAKKFWWAFIAIIIQTVIFLTFATIVYGFNILLYHFHGYFEDHPVLSLLFSLIFSIQFLAMLYLATLFIFYIPLIAIENKGALTALAKSIHLVWNHFWRTIAVQATPWLVYLGILSLIKLIFGLDVYLNFIDNPNQGLSSLLLHFVIFILLIPWVAALLLVQLKDLELRSHLTSPKKI